MDTPAYMTMVDQGPGSVEPPYRYRFIPTVAVNVMRLLPGYDIPIAFTEDTVAKKDFFHFVVLNFLLTVATSVLVFSYLSPKFGVAPAYLGSLLYLFSFYSIVTNIIPMTDAACHLAIITSLILFEKKQPLWFALCCLVGVFTKETLLIVLGLWIVLQGFQSRRSLWYLAYMLPGAMAYGVATHLFPALSQSAYYHSDFLLGNIYKAFSLREYDRHLIFQIFLAQTPLFAAVVSYIGLKFCQGNVCQGNEDLKLNKELWLFPFLIWLGLTMGIGNNAGRIAFMAFPAVIQFEVMILSAWIKSV